MHQDLQLIIDQTEEMFEFAEAGDWDKLGEIDQSRSQNLKAYFASEQVKLEPNAAEIIQAIQQKDKNILRMVLSAKDGLRLEMAQAGNSQRAVKAYLGG